MKNTEMLKMKYENRINTLRGRGDKNLKSPGVLKKLQRQLRNLDKN